MQKIEIKEDGLVKTIAEIISRKANELTAEEVGIILRGVEGDEYDEYRKVIAAAGWVAKKLRLPLDVTSEDFDHHYGAESWGNIWLVAPKETELIKKKYGVKIAEIFIGSAETPEEFARVFVKFLKNPKEFGR
ncbi:MAG: hypothetical protein QXH37_08305 [Candidatus Bathyarchaeia archaeon]